MRTIAILLLSAAGGCCVFERWFQGQLERQDEALEVEREQRAAACGTCAAGEECIIAESPARCRAVPLQKGEICGLKHEIPYDGAVLRDHYEFRCDGKMYCPAFVTGKPAVCSPPGGPGDPCDEPMGQCQEGLECNYWYTHAGKIFDEKRG